MTWNRSGNKFYSQIPMAVRISPSSLSFPGLLPTTLVLLLYSFIVVASSLYVNSVEFQNTSDEYVSYKIKTNMPDSYLVRPNCGILMPGASCEIQCELTWAISQEELIFVNYLSGT